MFESKASIDRMNLSSLNRYHLIYKLRYSAKLSFYAKISQSISALELTKKKIIYEKMIPVINAFQNQFNAELSYYEIRKHKEKPDKKVWDKMYSDIGLIPLINQEKIQVKEYLSIKAFNLTSENIRIEFEIKQNTPMLKLLTELKIVLKDHIEKYLFENIEEKSAIFEHTLIYTRNLQLQENISPFFNKYVKSPLPDLFLTYTTNEDSLTLMHHIETSQIDYILSYTMVLSIANLDALKDSKPSQGIHSAILSYFDNPKHKKHFRYELIRYFIKSPYIVVQFQASLYLNLASFVNAFKMAVSKRMHNRFSLDTIFHSVSAIISHEQNPLFF